MEKNLMNVSIILAAGVGSRMKKATKNQPKSLLKVCNKEILSYQIDALKSQEVDKIIVVTGYKSSMIKDFCDKNYDDVIILENKDYLNTNNMFSLLMALEEISDLDFDNLLINNADCLYEEEIFRLLLSDEYPDIFVGKKDEFDIESMKVEVDNGRITKISKSIRQKDSYGITLDLYKMSKKSSIILENKAREIINSGKVDLWSEVSLNEILKDVEFRFLDTKFLKWVEVDNSSDYIRAIQVFTDLSFRNKKTCFFDIDGTLFNGDSPIEHNLSIFSEMLNTKNTYLITNNTSRTKDDYIKKFLKHNLEINLENIITPLDGLISFIKDRGPSSYYILSNDKVRNYILSKCLELEHSEDSNSVILCYDDEIDYKKIFTCCKILSGEKNQELIATHSDMRCPTEFGFIPDIGCYLKMIENCTNKKPGLFFGKPDANMLKHLNFKPEESCLFGDRLYTDFLLSKNLGIDFVLSLNGDTTIKELIELSDEGKNDEIPQFILLNGRD